MVTLFLRDKLESMDVEHEGPQGTFWFSSPSTDSPLSLVLSLTKNGPRNLWTGAIGPALDQHQEEQGTGSGFVKTLTYDTSEYPGNGPGDGTISSVPGCSPEVETGPD